MKILKNPNDFILHGIYKMNPGTRSHVKVPYYVEVIEIGSNFIKTNIPKEHSLVITQDNRRWYANWDYHIGRFEYVGNSADNRKLLFNQKGLVPGSISGIVQRQD